MTSLKQLKEENEEYLFIEDVSSFNDVESILEALGNLPAGSLDLMKAHRGSWYTDLNKHAATQMHSGIGHHSVVDEPVRATKENINKHATSIFGFGKKEPSPAHQHIATLVYVHGKPHSILSYSIHHRPKTEEERRKTDFEHSWSRDNVGPLSNRGLGQSRIQKRADFADKIHSIVGKHGEGNVHLQKIGEDPHNKINRKRSQEREKEDELNKIRQHHADKYIERKLEHGNPQTEKHAEHAMNIINDIHNGLVKGEDVRRHVDRLKSIADAHANSLIQPKSYSNAESGIKKAKHVLGHGREQHDFHDKPKTRSQSLKAAKEHLRKVLGKD